MLGSVLFGLTGIAAYFAFVYWGLVEVGAAYGQVLLSLVPLITFFLACVQGLERFRWPGVAGAIITIAGIAIIFHQQAGQFVSRLSLLSLVAAAVCAAQAGIILKLFPPASLVAANTVAMSLGAAVLICLSVATGEMPVVPARPETWAAFAFLSTIGTIGTFLLVMYLLRHWSASAASYQYVLAPVVALALAAILLGERVGADFVVGGALVLSGVYLGAILPTRNLSLRARDAHRRE
jgi:drug/metabolite transporter (DMT)-like permease